MDRLVGMRNFSDKWIYGAASLRISNIKDHGSSEQHTRAMMLAESGGQCVSDAPILKSLLSLSEEQKEQLVKKFDIAYFVAIEKLPFTTYPPICALEARHGVNIGIAYVNEIAGKTFCHYIAEARRQELIETISKCSILMDASTDKGNIDDEIFLLIWCDIHGHDEKVHSKMSFLCVDRPKSVAAVGLYGSLEGALKLLAFDSVGECTKLIGLGTDGASANVAARGLKGLVEEKLPWVYFMWCLAHRLELAVSDALKHTLFNLIDEMLLRLYYIYEKSPKKCRELSDLVGNLRECMQFDSGNGIRPIRSSGSRWVAHKLNAMKRILELLPII
jgi:hypothetical protein